MAVLRKSRWSDACDRSIYAFATLGEGLGLCITTYLDDGDPLPAFAGEPYLLPLHGDIDDIAAMLWETLNEVNKVSLAVKFIDIVSGASRVVLRNKYPKV